VKPGSVPESPLRGVASDPVANLTEINGDWTLEGGVLVVTRVEEHLDPGSDPELQILATDAEGGGWDLTFGVGATRPSLQRLVGESLSKLVALATGELRLEFSDGTVLRVSPRGRAEAWEIRRDGVPILIGAPTGGGVVVL
jgi:hypothetical protein